MKSSDLTDPSETLIRIEIFNRKLGKYSSTQNEKD